MNDTDHRYSLVLYAAVLAWVIAIPIMAAFMPGETADGHYKVTDLSSHLQMCEEFTPEPERPVCREAAYETWSR